MGNIDKLQKICFKCSNSCESGSLKCSDCSEWVHYLCSEAPVYVLLTFQNSSRKYSCCNCVKKLCKNNTYEEQFNNVQNEIKNQRKELELQHANSNEIDKNDDVCEDEVMNHEDILDTNMETNTTTDSSDLRIEQDIESEKKVEEDADIVNYKDCNTYKEQFNDVQNEIKNQRKELELQHANSNKVDKKDDVCEDEIMNNETLDGAMETASTLIPIVWLNRQDVESEMELKKDENLVYKQFKCPQCNYSSEVKRELNRHVKIVHLKLKHYKCDRCDYAAARNSYLQIHINSLHSKIKKGKECSYNTTQKKVLRNRTATVDSLQKRYKCPQCSYKVKYK